MQRIETVLPPALVEKARRVIDANREAGLKIALAESCTGGLASAALTEIPGASDVFNNAFITYSDQAKLNQLDVHPDMLVTFGAVSPAVAWAMAVGALKKSAADVAVSITGIAGPDGGSELKPVGTVVFAKARRGDDPEKVVADQKHFEDSGRGGVRLQAALWALELLMPGSAEPSGSPEESGPPEESGEE